MCTKFGIFLVVTDTLSVSVASANNTHKFIAGQTIALTCHANSDSAKLTWVKESHLPASSDRHLETGRGQLLITDARVADSGEYRCVATRAHDTAYASIAIKVKGTFKFTSSSVSIM